MFKTQDLLSEITDIELMNLYKYRFESMMLETQNQVLREFQNRNIPLQEIELRLKDSRPPSGNNSVYYCKRCYSSRFYSYTEEDTINIGTYNSITLQNDFHTCVICLYSDEKENYKKQRAKTWNIFGLINFFVKRRFKV